MTEKKEHPYFESMAEIAALYKGQDATDILMLLSQDDFTGDDGAVNYFDPKNAGALVAHKNNAYILRENRTCMLHSCQQVSIVTFADFKESTMLICVRDKPQIMPLTEQTVGYLTRTYNLVLNGNEPPRFYGP